MRGGDNQSCGCAKKRADRVRTWRGCGEISGAHYTHYRLHAKDCKREFSVSIEYLWDLFLKQDRKCAYTGMALTMNNRGCGPGNTASIDRIDSSIGYREGNVQWVHKVINRMKQHFDEAVFVEMCRMTATHWFGNQLFAEFIEPSEVADEC